MGFTILHCPQKRWTGMLDQRFMPTE
ncbi:hypothetical protein ACHAW6_000387 [Cyclotella cf. meneghiniana]